MEKFYFIENLAYFPLFVDVEAGITLSDGSSNGNIIESDSERLSDHSGDDYNESVVASAATLLPGPQLTVF